MQNEAETVGSGVIRAEKHIEAESRRLAQIDPAGRHHRAGLIIDGLRQNVFVVCRVEGCAAARQKRAGLQIERIDAQTANLPVDDVGVIDIAVRPLGKVNGTKTRIRPVEEFDVAPVVHVDGEDFTL